MGLKLFEFFTGARASEGHVRMPYVVRPLGSCHLHFCVNYLGTLCGSSEVCE